MKINNVVWMIWWGWVRIDCERKLSLTVRCTREYKSEWCEVGAWRRFTYSLQSLAARSNQKRGEGLGLVLWRDWSGGWRARANQKCWRNPGENPGPIKKSWGLGTMPRRDWSRVQKVPHQWKALKGSRKITHTNQKCWSNSPDRSSARLCLSLRNATCLVYAQYYELINLVHD